MFGMNLKTKALAVSVTVLAEILLRSPRKSLFFRIKVSKIKLINCFWKIIYCWRPLAAQVAAGAEHACDGERAAARRGRQPGRCDRTRRGAPAAPQRQHTRCSGQARAVAQPNRFGGEAAAGPARRRFCTAAQPSDSGAFTAQQSSLGGRQWSFVQFFFFLILWSYKYICRP